MGNDHQLPSRQSAPRYGAQSRLPSTIPRHAGANGVCSQTPGLNELRQSDMPSGLRVIGISLGIEHRDCILVDDLSTQQVALFKRLERYRANVKLGLNILAANTLGFI